jgi:hypothetical protein
VSALMNRSVRYRNGAPTAAPTATSNKVIAMIDLDRRTG